MERTVSVPFIDPDVKYLSVSGLRSIGGQQLVSDTTIIMNKATPVAVLIPYSVYMELQSLIELGNECGKKIEDLALGKAAHA